MNTINYIADKTDYANLLNYDSLAHFMVFPVWEG